MLNIFAKYTWVKPLIKDKKVKTVLIGFIKIINESKHKINRLWTDQRKKFWNSFYWLTNNESKSVIAERFIRTLNKLVIE